MRTKLLKYYEKGVVYTQRQWKLLRELRDRAIEVMDALEKNGINCIVHGSIARGDVNEKSDIDLFIPYQIPSFKLELILKDNFGISGREIIQATSWHLIKGCISLDEKTTVTFPLVRPERNEIEFYYFGGALDLAGLKRDKRTMGVDKRLVLIVPTSKGHRESSILGKEAEVAKILDISLDTVKERIQVLMRRDKVGRTGIYLKRTLGKEEHFEQVLKILADRNADIKRRMKKG